MTIQRAFRSRAGVTLVDVAEYAQVKRLALRRNPVLGTIQLSKGDQVAILPLAAKAMKLGGRWLDVREFTALRDVRMVAPLAPLEDAF